MENNELKLHVISQTHWDREWYQTFEGFRKRLVLMMDELIETLEKNQDYECFTIDGQTIVIEDYLAIRPENESRLRKLIESGKIIAGPWYVMPDEFLVSGESLVRNLKHGRELTASFGSKPMNCGYVVDIFGHNSQFPQILRGFGIDSAVLFRGIGNYPKDLFDWEAKDGSTVLCAKLDPDRCYSNFYFALRWPFDGREYEADELVNQLQKLLDYAKPRAVSCNLIMMDGVDHIEIEPKLPWILQTLRERIPGIEITHTTIDRYFQAQRDAAPSLDTLHGELYICGSKGLNNSVLKNVLSSMVDLKQLNDECERRLTRWAEPFAAAVRGLARGDMNGLIRYGWKSLMQNHPHDSICGCSISRVYEDNLFRFNQVMDITDEVTSHLLGAIAEGIQTAREGTDHALVLFNPMQREFDGVVEVEAELPVEYAANFLLTDEQGQTIPYQVIDITPSTYKGVFRYRRLPEFHKVKKVRLALQTRLPSVGYSTLWLAQKPTRFPGFGEYTYPEFNPVVRYRGTMLTGFNIWENEFVKVKLNSNGSLTAENKASGRVWENLGIYEDCGDCGDGWNYRKPKHDTVQYSSSCSSDIGVDADGPLLTRWLVRTCMNVPAELDAGETRRSHETIPLQVTTAITMRAGSSRLEFHTEVDNCAAGHRFRVLFPTGVASDNYYASTPFSIEKRNVHFADTADFQEEETFVMPNQGFVALQDDAGSIAIYNKGLYEVQVTEDASRTVALTLFRSFPHEVGQDESKLGKMLKKMSFEYAVELGSGAASVAELFMHSEAYRAGLRSVTLPVQSGSLPASHSWLQIQSRTTVMSCFKRSDSNPNLMVIRLYNPSDEDETVQLVFDREIRAAYLLDLDEKMTETIAHDGTQLNLSVGKWKILTAGVSIDDIILS